MNWICIGLAAAAALSLYLASTHQRLWPGARPLAAMLRWLAALLLAGAAASATAGYGLWCAVCMALGGLMAVLVALPYLDAWRRGRDDAKEVKHVG
jgi:hypothetical protein